MLRVVPPYRKLGSPFAALTPPDSGYAVATPPVFDGTNDFMLRGADLTGLSDSKSGIFSCWYRLDGGDASNLYLIHNTATKFYIRRDGTLGYWSILGRNAASATRLDMRTAGTYFQAAGWHHLIMAWDLASSVGHLYVDGVSDKNAGATLTNGTLAYSAADWAVASLTTGGSPFFGALAEYYFAPGQYLDISQAANLAKFRANGRPVSLGTDGSLPTGTAPKIYLKNIYSSFQTNSGTGGNFSVTGTLTASADAP